MKFSELAGTAIQRYGQFGDDSFECFGLTVENGRISESRLYRFAESRRGGCIDWTDSVGSDIRRVLTVSGLDEIVRLHEISKQMVGPEPRCKWYFSIKPNIPFEKHRTATDTLLRAFGFSDQESWMCDLETGLSKKLSPGRSPLLRLAVEVREDGTPIVLKTHFSLERFTHWQNREGEKLTFQSLSDSLHEILNEFGLSDTARCRVTQIGEILSDYNYYPFLLGINHSANDQECKLYFRVRRRDHPPAIIFSAQCALMSALGGPLDIGSLNAAALQLSQLGLFAEGVAISQRSSGESIALKAYFFPLPKVRV